MKFDSVNARVQVLVDFRTASRTFAACMLVAMCCGVFPCLALAAPQWTEISATTTGPFPVDVATTFNNNRAAARYADPAGSNSEIVTVWSLAAAGLPTGPIWTLGSGSFKSGSQTSLGNGATFYEPSDRIEMTNTRSVSIGSGRSASWVPGTADDETYIETIDVSATPPVLLNVQEVITPTATANSSAGFANDVVITRDGAWAVVNSNNWIHIVDVASGKLLTFGYPGGGTLPGFNIGAYDYIGMTAWNRPCTPNQAVDSVAVTNDRAVITTARLTTSAPITFRTWVYIVDLSTTPMSIVLQKELIPGFLDDEGGDRPHDITLNYDPAGAGQIAVVTTTHMVAAFNLVNNTFLNSYFDALDRRSYQTQVDSVEATDTNAVVISDNSALGTPRWHVQLFGLSLVSGLGTPVDYFGANNTQAHDLAIDKTFDKAIVRTSFANVVVTSMVTPPLSANVIASPNSSDAYAYQGFASAYASVFSSDAAVISPVAVSGYQFAATIGGQIISGIYHGYVDIVDLAVTPPALVGQVRIDSNAATTIGCVPLDLAISSDHAEVVVRSADPSPGTAPAAGADLVRISLSPSPAITFSYDGQGILMGLDSLAVPATGLINVTKRMLSIEQEPVSNKGYAHVAR